MVWPLKTLTPICFIAFPLAIRKLENGWFKYIIVGYTGAEILFYGWFRRALGLAQKRIHPPSTTRKRRDEIWNGIQNSALEGESPYEMIKHWFGVSTLAKISRLQLKEWLSWALFDRKYEELLNEEQKIEMDWRIQEGEKAFSITIPDEALEEVPAAMRLNVDPVLAEHRPLIHYVATGLMSFGSDIALYARGFRRHEVGPVSFWILKGDDAKPPLVFVHGVGIGLATYLPFLLKLSSAEHRSGRTLILIELPHVSMKLNVDVIPRMETIAECAAIMFKQHNLQPALWVAHSLGTFVFAVVNRLQPDLVAGVVLCDPVCFLLWEPDLLRNFCYREPDTPLRIIMNFHVCRELSISYYFHRHFWWHECVQFANQMPKKSLVYVSEFDDIYNTKRVRKYLTQNKVPMEIFSGASHGGWILDNKSTLRILESLQLKNL